MGGKSGKHQDAYHRLNYMLQVSQYWASIQPMTTAQTLARSTNINAIKIAKKLVLRLYVATHILYTYIHIR